MKIFNGKKGLERWMLIMIILAILGFAIILWFLFITKPYSVVDKEACRTSIRLRSIAVLGEPLKAAAPLQCKTEPIKIDNKNYKTEEQINKRIADAMAECWSMVGEGKLNFMPRDWAGQKYCLICSTINFDDKISKDFPVVTGILRYMSDTKFQGEKTYYNYIFGDDATFSGKSDLSIDTFNEYAIVFTLYEGGWLTRNLPAGIGVIALWAIFPPSGLVSALIIGGAGALGGAFVGNPILSFFSSHGDLDSSLQMMKYDFKEINKYCTKFDNAP